MSRRDEQNGLWFPDIYLEYVKGYSPLSKAVEDGLEGLRKEIDAFLGVLFPMIEVPVEDRPGYVTHEHNYFHINHPHEVLKESLEKYFLLKYSRISRDLYGGDHNFAGFLTGSLHDLLLYGRVHYVIKWGEVEVGGKKVILPISFDRLDTLTTRKRLLKSGFVQKYSLYSYYFQYHFKPTFGDKRRYNRKFEFEDDEILSFYYPFGSQTPVRQIYKLVPKLKAFWQFGIDQQRTTLEPENHSFPLEYARHKNFNEEKRKVSLMKSQVKTAFNNVIDTGTNITSYYDVYTVNRYKKRLNDLRHYLVKTFNEQVMARVAEKNGWKKVPEIYFDHFQTNEELDSIFKDFSEHKVSISEYVDRVVKKD